MSDVFNDVVARMSRIRGVRGALIAEADAGMAVVAELSEGVDGAAVAALAASLFRRSLQAASAAEFGALDTLQLDAEAGRVVAVAAGELILIVVAERDAQLGMVRLEAHRAARELA